MSERKKRGQMQSALELYVWSRTGHDALQIFKRHHSIECTAAKFQKGKTCLEEWIPHFIFRVLSHVEKFGVPVQ